VLVDGGGVYQHAAQPNTNSRGRTREPGHNRETFKRQFAICVALGVTVTVAVVGSAVAVSIGLARRARQHAGSVH
jgi:hypothetical protein